MIFELELERGGKKEACPNDLDKLCGYGRWKPRSSGHFHICKQTHRGVNSHKIGGKTAAVTEMDTQTTISVIFVCFLAVFLEQKIDIWYNGWRNPNRDRMPNMGLNLKDQYERHARSDVIR